MRSIAIIPARMGSSRFPGKPMKKIIGRPMIEHVYQRVKMSSFLDEVYVATCDDDIFTFIKSIGGKVVMTSDLHERCTERTAEAIEKIEKELKKKFEIIVMVQGDEPMVTPEMIDVSIKTFKNSKGIKVVNLITKIFDKNEFNDPNEVKVVKNLNNDAIYFSREPIPSIKKEEGFVDWYKQVCIIPFDAKFLRKFNKLSTTPLEQQESVDMMRVIEHGEIVKLAEIKGPIYSVDTKKDLERVETLMKDDELIKHYDK